MPEMRGVTVKIPADLHAEVKAYIEAHNMTMGEFITLAVDNELHPKIQITQEDKNIPVRCGKLGKELERFSCGPIRLCGRSCCCESARGSFALRQAG